jgi:hypothetical protein
MVTRSFLLAPRHDLSITRMSMKKARRSASGIQFSPDLPTPTAGFSTGLGGAGGQDGTLICAAEVTEIMYLPFGYGNNMKALFMTAASKCLGMCLGRKCGVFI